MTEVRKDGSIVTGNVLYPCIIRSRLSDPVPKLDYIYVNSGIPHFHLSDPGSGPKDTTMDGRSPPFGSLLDHLRILPTWLVI